MYKFALTRAPVNGTAAKVVGKGYKYKPGIKPSDNKERESDTCFPLADYQETFSAKLHGIKFGRLTTIGASAIKGSGNGRKKVRMWVCRCSCGMFVYRTPKAIKNPKNDADACIECRHHMAKKKSELWRRAGIEKPHSYFV